MPNKASRKRRRRRKVEHIHVFVDSADLDAAMAELLETIHFLDDAEGRAPDALPRLFSRERDLSRQSDSTTPQMNIRQEDIVHPSVQPIIDSYADGKISFDQLVAELVAFPHWRKPVPEKDTYGGYPEHDFGQPGTYEEVEAALILGQITEAEEKAIRAALDAELVRKYGSEVLRPKHVEYPPTPS